jgi:hypothetical protein
MPARSVTPSRKTYITTVPLTQRSYISYSAERQNYETNGGLKPNKGSRYSSVSIVTTGWTTGFGYPAGAGYYYSPHHHFQTCSEVHPISYTMDTVESFPGGKVGVT